MVATNENFFALKTLNLSQEKYSGCRPGTGMSRLTSPATFETPEEPAREFDPRRPQVGTSLTTRQSREGGGGRFNLSIDRLYAIVMLWVSSCDG